MAFEPKYEKVFSGYREKLGKTQVVVDFKLPMNDNVSKVLCTSAKVYIANAEAQDKVTNYNGFVGFQVIYKNDTGDVAGSTFTAEFRDKYESDVDLTNSTPIILANVVDTTTSLDNGEVKVSAIIELDIDIIRQSETNALVDVSDMVVKKEDFSFSKYDGMLYDKWEVLSDVEIKDSVKNVLAVVPNVYIENVTPNDKFVTVKGGVCVDICYVTDENVLRTQNETISFTQEIAGEFVNDLSEIESVLSNDINENKITTTIDTDSSTLNIVLPMVYKGYVFNLNTIDVVADAYSLTNYTNFTTTSITTYKAVEDVAWEEKITNTLQLEETAPVVDEVLGTCCDNIVVASTTISDDAIVVEGFARTTLIYLNKETNTINSVEIDIPFSTSRAVDVENSASANTFVSLINVVGKARRGKDLEVSGTLLVYVDLYGDMQEGAITDISIEDEMPENGCAMSFYFAKDGDTIWDVAKDLSITTDDLLAQNPNLTDPIERGTRIVVYRQKVVEY